MRHGRHTKRYTRRIDAASDEWGRGCWGDDMGDGGYSAGPSLAMEEEGAVVEEVRRSVGHGGED